MNRRQRPGEQREVIEQKAKDKKVPRQTATEQRAPRWRRTTAAFALTAILGLGLTALVPSLGAAGTTTAHSHGALSTSTTLESAAAGSTSAPATSAGTTAVRATPTAKPKKDTPIPASAVVKSTLGGGPETSLKSAATAADAPARKAKPLKGKRGDVDAAALLAESPTDLGGCLTEYGDAGQCLPVVPPSESAHVQAMVAAGLDPASMPHQWKCKEVRTYFRDGLAVRVAGVDPQKLDRDADGVACGPKD